MHNHLKVFNGILRNHITVELQSSLMTSGFQLSADSFFVICNETIERKDGFVLGRHLLE